MVPVPDLTNLSRSAAMVLPAQTLPVEARLLAELCDEKLTRRLHAGSADGRGV